MGGGQGNAGACRYFAHHSNRGGEIARQQHQYLRLIGLLRQSLFDVRRNLGQRLAGRRNAAGERHGDASFSVDRLFGQRGRQRGRRHPRGVDLGAAEQRGGRGLPDGNGQKITRADRLQLIGTAAQDLRKQMPGALRRQPLRDFLVHVNELDRRQWSLVRRMFDISAAGTDRGEERSAAGKQSGAERQAGQLGR
jgi:hypothetical protein